MGHTGPLDGPVSRVPLSGRLYVGYDAGFQAITAVWTRNGPWCVISDLPHQGEVKYPVFSLIFFQVFKRFHVPQYPRYYT